MKASSRPDAAALTRRQWAILLVLSCNMVLDAIEVSVILVALPTISDRLHLSLWTAQWLMSGFAAGFAVLLVSGSRIARRWGQRPAYLAAMGVFAVASVAGGLASDPAVLIAVRVVKGGCAAMTAPAGMAVITTTFPDGPAQRQAVSVYSLFGAAGFSAGLLLSGAFLEASWRWTFLFPVPVSLVLLFLGLRLLPAAPARQPPPGSGIAPLRDASLLRSALGAASLNGNYISLLLLMTFQIQQRFGWAPWQASLGLLPASVPLAMTTPFAGRVVGKLGTGRLIACGALAAAAGDALFLWHPRPASYLAGMLPVLLLVETGFVLSFAALNMQATATIAPAARGLAVSLYQTGVQLGGVLALPSAALLATSSWGTRAAPLLMTAIGGAGLLAALSGLPAGRLPRSRTCISARHRGCRKSAMRT